MRTAAAVFALIVSTIFFGTLVIIASLIGVKDRDGSIYDWAPRWWARCIVWASRVKVVVHDVPGARIGRHVFVVNHVTLFDVLAVATVVPRVKFVAKAELANIPLFSRAMRSAGMVFIERANRKAAFESYRNVAGRISEGGSVVVFAEGTRGTSYALRPLKKGPFVLAIDAAAPVVPTVVYGTMQVLTRNPFRVYGGTVHVHFLEPVPTAGLDYDQRDTIAAKVHARMAEVLRSEYGVESPLWEPRRAVIG